VVDAYGVKQLKARAKAIHPPTVAVFFHLYPVIKRVAPLLAELAEIIQRHARHKPQHQRDAHDGKEWVDLPFRDGQDHKDNGRHERKDKRKT